ncbi:phosphate starvation-inducible protein PhoH [Peribacillus sp. NPDC097295]|uniref:phosphate starvation-inducible protein PhoH n=1 Tax=Peribacillus sp. NPDC097295 TaxID=3364402 RepID=UPI0037F678D3
MNEHIQDFLMLDTGSYFGKARVNDPDYQDDFTFIDTYELPNIDLKPYKCLVIPGLVDQKFLYKYKKIIQAFLNDKKIVVFSGNLYLEWLPGGANFIPKAINGYQDYVVSIHQPHPIFEGVEEDDMTYNKGVSGFFARGHHPVPKGAEVLLTLPGGEPITYIDRYSTSGTILVHSGNDLFGSKKVKKTTNRISPQLMRWVRDEYSKLQERCEGE